jgi:hypothetical protein
MFPASNRIAVPHHLHAGNGKGGPSTKNDKKIEEVGIKACTIFETAK